MAFLFRQDNQLLSCILENKICIGWLRVKHGERELIGNFLAIKLLSILQQIDECIQLFKSYLGWSDNRIGLDFPKVTGLVMSSWCPGLWKKEFRFVITPPKMSANSFLTLFHLYKAVHNQLWAGSWPTTLCIFHHSSPWQWCVSQKQHYLHPQQDTWRSRPQKFNSSRKWVN